jgi:hypothetical protein
LFNDQLATFAFLNFCLNFIFMHKLLYIFLLVATTSYAQAPAPFWAENFGNGLPTNWISDDASGQDIIWTWCSNPEAGNSEAGCSPVWDNAAQPQVPFNATTATNGFVTVDSDAGGELTNDHISRLTTTPINCAGKPTVFVRFQSLLGTYTYNADDKALLKVSTDQTNWVSFQIFFGVTTSNRWSENPEVSIIDISSVAGNQSTVYLRWEWTGNYEYVWNLDDIEVFDQNPTPRHDLGLGDFFYPASSYAQPASELRTDTFGFYGRVSNFGLTAQTNVELKAWITDATGVILFADSAKINTLPVGYVDSLIILDDLYVPELGQGTYNIHYQVSADSTDARPINNVQVRQFVATAGQFAKEDSPEQYFRPASAATLAKYAVCNYYRTSKSSPEQYRALSAEFAYTIDPAELDISNIQAALYLLKVKDNIADDLDNLDNSTFLASFDWVGLGEYASDATTVDDGSIRTVGLLDFASGEEGIALEEGARYMLAIEYANDNVLVYHAYNDDNNYFFNSTLLYDGSDFLSFGPDANAVLRLNLGLVSTTDNNPLPEQAMQLFPNPATDNINIDVKLEKSGPLAITIADASGKVIVMDNYDNVQQQLFNYKLPKLAAGTYLARIATNEGTLTKPFTVVGK